MKVFKEEQRFTQTWFVLIMVLSILIPIGIITQEFMKEDSNLKSSSFIGIVTMLIIFIVPIFFIKLKTKIDEVGIHYQFFPFHLSLKTISWNEIKEADVRSYDPIGEYGGWGLKGGWSKKRGKAINVSGDIGIQLVLKDETKLLIGTNKESDAKRVLLTYQSKLIKDV